jgi:hypothetical protein
MIVGYFNTLFILGVLGPRVLNVRSGHRGQSPGKLWAVVATRGWDPQLAVVLGLATWVILVGLMFPVAHQGLCLQRWSQAIVAVALGVALYF